MTAKLYLIKSEERDELIKIGRTDSTVYERFGGYSGLADSSMVYEVSGERIFEDYFHTFINQNRKPIRIRFKLTGKERNPREWFVLSSSIAEVFATAFSQTHPTNIDDLPVEDLPIFLSGALSAIHWHAHKIAMPGMAEVKSREDILTALEEINEPHIEPVEELGHRQERPQNQTRESKDLESTLASYALPPELVLSIGKAAAAKAEIAEMKEMETSRTIIAVATAIMIAFLLLTKAAIAGCIFAIFSSLVYAFWPHIQPIGAAILVNISDYLQDSVQKIRHRFGGYDD